MHVLSGVDTVPAAAQMDCHARVVRKLSSVFVRISPTAPFCDSLPAQQNERSAWACSAPLVLPPWAMCPRVSASPRTDSTLLSQSEISVSCLSTPPFTSPARTPRRVLLISHSELSSPVRNSMRTRRKLASSISCTANSRAFPLPEVGSAYPYGCSRRSRKSEEPAMHRAGDQRHGKHVGPVLISGRAHEKLCIGRSASSVPSFSAPSSPASSVPPKDD